MTLKFNFSINIDIEDCKLRTIIASFNEIKKNLLDLFVQQVVVEFAVHYMNQNTKPFDCQKCGNNTNFIWKTKHGKKTNIITILQTLVLKQLQVQCKNCNHKFYITQI